MASARPTRATGKKKKKVRELDAMAVGVASIMTKRVLSVRPDTSLEAAMELLMAKDISHLPVVEDGALVGVLSKTDLVRERFMNGSTEEHGPMKVSDRKGATFSPGPGFHEDDALSRTVSELMSAKVRSVSAASTVAEAAIAMAKFRVHGLPVVNDRGGLVGFVSSLDIVRWVAAA